MQSERPSRTIVQRNVRRGHLRTETSPLRDMGKGRRWTMGELVLMIDTGKKAFAKRLRAYRILRYDTAKELAIVLDLEEQTYRKYEQGRAYPKYGTLQRICAALGCDQNDLLPPASKKKRAGDPADFDPIPLRRKK